MELFEKLPNALLPWYRKCHRDLPWRNSADPYHIWVSEIMLQQTRVEAVKGYYERFLKTLPDISSLSKASDEILHKLWEGLGYYTRVRNLKKAAQMIEDRFGGVFPNQYKQVISLPGIGEYTAGAICSIAFNLPTPAVDGNVLRVISRITNDDRNIDLPEFKKYVREQLKVVYPANAGEFTQALMELGATICGPNRKPDCAHCPCSDFCLGFRIGTACDLPVRSPKKHRKMQNKTVFIISSQGKYALIKRPDKGLLAGLWQFPDCPEILTVEGALSKVVEMGFSPKQIYGQVERNHIFTHVEWVMRGIYLEVEYQIDGCEWFSPQQISENTALPTAYRQFWGLI